MVWSSHLPCRAPPEPFRGQSGPILHMEYHLWQVGVGLGGAPACLSAPLLPSDSGNFVKLQTATPSQVLGHIVQLERVALTAQLSSLTKEEVGVAWGVASLGV